MVEDEPVMPVEDPSLAPVDDPAAQVAAEPAPVVTELTPPTSAAAAAPVVDWAPPRRGAVGVRARPLRSVPHCHN